ncbi:MAG: YceI family protein [Acidobacteriota bacterium]
MVRRAHARRRLAAALGAGLLGLIGSVQTASAQQPNVEFSVSGTSTVRSWTCTANGTLVVTAGGGTAALPGFDKGVQAATLTVPLKSFVCPNEEMTQHLNEAMKADKFPEIVYRLEKYEVAGGQATVTGAMTITGVTQPVTVPVALKGSPQGLQLEGNTRMEFKTFSLDPPTVMLGLLKVGPQLRITFKGMVAP